MDYERQTKKAIDDGSTSSSASKLAGEFEVFLSFRGIDTRKGLTDFLYNDLISAGVRTFRDDNELRVGEKIGPELLKAINKSIISIPIFSKNYASSKWCLLELAQMVECHTIAGQKILPIFYDVLPDNVRHQTGSYEEAFRQHYQRFDEETVKGWKEALRKVGELKGWELEKETNGRQGEFVKKFVSKVLLELKKNCMAVTPNLVGIDHHVEKMMGLLNVDSHDVRIVGIHGMGGIGKTTIAKFIYNKLSEQFDCCCFLENVREMSQHHKGLLKLQKRLISEIRRAKCNKIADVSEGIKTIQNLLCHKKVLLVLDDVYERPQFDHLVGQRDWFGSGSSIIITTRNKEVLGMLEVDETYEPKLMEDDHALQLFSKHAFGNDFPPQDFDELSREVVLTTGKLPLALEIIGSLLFRKGEIIWRETLKKLKNKPNRKVMDKLRISYEALEPDEKQIFLDIACHFVGTDKTLPFYMWDSCEFYPANGIDALVYRSLLKIEDGNVLRMHDLISDLGREIVREEKDLEERSRLWNCDALNILENRMGTNKVEVICLGNWNYNWRTGLSGNGRRPLTHDNFGKLKNLRFLEVDYTTLTGDFKHLLSNLKWLQWRGCTESFMPINFHLKNLVILDLSDSDITENWEGWSQFKMSTNLKVLDLSFCRGLTRTPDFSTFPNLERLILSACHNLVEIDSSIGKLINLRVLHISDTGIRKLPDGIGAFEKLEEIYASGCRAFEGVIPSSIGRLSSLKILNFNHTWIQSLPTSICRLSRLQTLELAAQCGLLRSLPEVPPSLTTLSLTCRFCGSIYDCSYSLPSSIEPHISRTLTQFSIKKILPLSRSNLITSQERCSDQVHPEVLHHLMPFTDLLPPRFTELYRIDCELSERLPDMQNSLFESEWDVIVCWFFKLDKFDGLERMTHLRRLRILYCESLERLPDLSSLKELQELAIYECHKLMEIPSLVRLKYLKFLVVTKCRSIERLPDLSTLRMLQTLDLSYCEKLVEVMDLEGLKSLKTLDMSNCRSMERLPDISTLIILKRVVLSYCEKLVEVRGLEDLIFLETLDMSQCRSIERLPDLSTLRVLKTLDLSYCEKLVEVMDLGGLISLKTLDMSNCRSIERLPNLSTLRILKTLDLSYCEKLVEVWGLGILIFLETLDMSQCRSIERLPNLSNLTSLKTLNLSYLEKLVEVRGLGSLTSLKSLNMSHCRSIGRLPDLSDLTMLGRLNLSYCEKLVEVRGLGSLIFLKTLNMSHCKSIERLSDLSDLTMLRRLNLSYCEKLVEVRGLEDVKSLGTLGMLHCKSLLRLHDLSTLKYLKDLRISGGQNLTDVRGLQKLESLEFLSVGAFRLPAKSLDLSNLQQLKELKVFGCEKLTEIRGLEEMKFLTFLEISGCNSIESLPYLPNTKILQRRICPGSTN